MSELRERIIRSLQVPREKAARMGYKNAKGALDSVSASFVGTTLNEGVKFFDRTTLDRGKNEISQGGETCDIRFSVNATSPFKERRLSGPAISFFAERIIHFSNYNAIVDTLGDFYEVYGNASAADPTIDFGEVIGDAVMNPGDTPGSLKLDVLYFKNNTMGSLREKAAGFEDALHYMFGNERVPENAPTPSGKTPADDRTSAEIAQDEAYYSPIEVFIRDVTAEAIRSWGTDDPKIQANIAMAVRRAVREGLERGNERANAINNINMACDDVLAVFSGLTRENYQEKMDKYINLVTTKPELVNYYTSHYTPFPAGPVPSTFILEGLKDFYSKPENADRRPANLETMSPDELRALAGMEGVATAPTGMPVARFNSFEHACRMSTMHGEHVAFANSEIAGLRERGAAAQATIDQQNEYWGYWAAKYTEEEFVVGGVTIKSRPFIDPALKSGSNDALRNCISKRIDALNREIVRGGHSPSVVRKLRNEISILQYDRDIIDGKIPDKPKTRYIDGVAYETRRPANIFATISDQSKVLASCNAEIESWNTYRDSLGKIAPQNDAMLLMTCCSILYDLNLNKMGGEIITANDVLERIGYDSVAGGIKYDPEYQKQALSILNNLFFLNEEQRVNTKDGGTIHQTTQMFQHFVHQIHSKYAMPIGEDEHGNKIYPPGKLPMDKLYEHMKAIGMDKDSPFFGRATELFEQMTTAMGIVDEGYAINNFNPVKACYAQMDPKLKDLNYRKLVMDYYKKEGLLPAKEVKIKNITYVLGDEYKPSPVIEPPPGGDPPPPPPPPPPPEKNPNKLDYCAEVAAMMHHKRMHVGGAKTQSGEKVFGDDVTEDQYYAGQRMAYASAEAWFKNLIGKDDEFVRVQALLKDGIAKGKSIPEIMAEVRNADPKDPVLKHLKSLKDPQTFRYVVSFCPDLIGDRDKTSMGKYYTQIQLYNSEIDKLIAGEPTSLSLEQLALLHDSLDIGADYKAGRSNSIFPVLMNQGIKLVFSQLNELQITGSEGTGDAKHATFGFVLPFPDPKNPGKVIYNKVTPAEYLQRFRIIAMEKAKELDSLMNTKTYAKFKDFLTVRVDKGEIVITNDLVHGGSRRGVRTNTFEKPESQMESIGSKIVSPASLKPGQTVYVLDADKGLIEVPTETYQTMPGAPKDLVQVSEGKFVSISHIGAINDLAISSMKELKRRREMEAGGEMGGGGAGSGLAEPVEIKPQHDGDLPEFDPVVDMDTDVVPVSGDDGMGDDGGM